MLLEGSLQKGDTDEAVIAYVVSRYGEFVLLKPRFEAKTVILWGMPVILLLCGGVALVVAARRRSAGMPGTPLSDKEREELDKLLRS